ncbi:MAG: DUF2249 domain-containing protein [Tepidiphilus sp.]|nr:DUF2249 domain-containing protein [Tepidiphilus sp.]
MTGSPRFHRAPEGYAETEAMLFDARELLPPDPFVRTLELLERLEGGRWVRLLLYRVPWPLFEAIEPDGWTHREYVHDDGTVEVHLFRPLNGIETNAR